MQEKLEKVKVHKRTTTNYKKTLITTSLGSQSSANAFKTNSQLLFSPSRKSKSNKYFLEVSNTKDQINEKKKSSFVISNLYLVFTAFDSGQYSLFVVLKIDFLRKKHFKETNFTICFC